MLKGRGIARLQQTMLPGSVGAPQRRLTVGQFVTSYGQTPRDIEALGR